MKISAFKNRKFLTFKISFCLKIIPGFDAYLTVLISIFNLNNFKPYFIVLKPFCELFHSLTMWKVLRFFLLILYNILAIMLGKYSPHMLFVFNDVYNSLGVHLLIFMQLNLSFSRFLGVACLFSLGKCRYLSNCQVFVLVTLFTLIP